jgi:hypothetical protein
MPLFLVSVQQAETAGLAPPIKGAQATYDKCLKEVKASATAKGIIDALTKAPKKIGILIIDEGFDSMYIPPHILADVENAADFTGGVAVLNSKSIMKIGGQAIPLGVSLMHELGHAKQSLTNAKRFEKYFNLANQKDGAKQSKKIAALALQLKKSIDKAAQLAIENENVTLHEKPICTEIGCNSRDSYD